ncbi:C2 domain protein [Aphelenchoides besseyi]|nr:C2 domain protein [Aphelenchoides besseyi]KAI6210772.1 C2 domain protein [Aphelenchoides besseyi]
MYKQQSGGPSNSVELTFSARKLADRDVFSKSDPILVMYREGTDGGLAREVGRTEQIQNSLNPNWNKKIKIDYFFEAKQPLIFKLYDIDTNSTRLDEQDFLGQASCDLADIVAAPNGYLTLKLSGAKYVKGSLIVHADEVDQGQRQVMEFKIQGINLSKKSLFSKPNPFLEFYRFLPDGTRQLAYRSSVCQNTVNPEWPAFEISAQSLSGLDTDQEFLIECYAHRTNGSHKFIGSIRCSLNQLNGKTGLTIPLRNDKKSKQVTETDAPFGSLRFNKSILRREYSFLEYLASGLQLEFAVSVDFTASNGPIHSCQSLHYIDSRYPNQYELAIRSVLEICEHYNHRKIFDAMGFGAKIPPNFDVRHLFPLTLNPQQRGVLGTQGVLNAYKNCLKNTQLYGPTNFEPSIQEFAQKARLFPKDGTRYQILLIITDGVITDMAKTKAAIVNASSLPLSIIIVGVGQEDFEKMEELDSDDVTLTANGRTAKRDIVQFVPFRQFMPSTGIHSEIERENTQARLAKEVLAEVPDQVTSYMKSMNIAARPAPSVPPAYELESQTSQDYPSTYPSLNYDNQQTAPPYPTENHFSNQPPMNPNYSYGAV